MQEEKALWQFRQAAGHRLANLLLCHSGEIAASSKANNSLVFLSALASSSKPNRVLGSRQEKHWQQPTTLQQVPIPDE